MEPLRNIDLARQIAHEHEASLHAAARAGHRDAATVRRWIGSQLIRTGTRLLTDAPIRAAGAA